MQNNKFQLFIPKLHVGAREELRIQFPPVCAKINVSLHHIFSEVKLSPGFEKHFFHVIDENVVQLLGVKNIALKQQ